MHSPTNIYHFPNWLRTADRLDHAAARARIASAYARGDARRRDDTAGQLEELAGEFRSGEHGELLLSMAARLLELRAKRAGEFQGSLASAQLLQSDDELDQSC